MNKECKVCQGTGKTTSYYRGDSMNCAFCTELTPVIDERAAELEANSCRCEECYGSGMVWDPTSCGDEDHCSPWMSCIFCREAGHDIYGAYGCNGTEE